VKKKGRAAIWKLKDRLWKPEKIWIPFSAEIWTVPNWIQASANCKALTMLTASQYRIINGEWNNGSLTATFEQAKKAGLYANKTLHAKVLDEAQYYGLLIQTVKGGKIGGEFRPHRFAVAWYRIDPPQFDLEYAPWIDDQIGTLPSAWLQTRPKFCPRDRSPRFVLIQGGGNDEGDGRERRTDG